jgi:hypothetical protein
MIRKILPQLFKKIKPINESRGTYVPPSNVQPPPKFKDYHQTTRTNIMNTEINNQTKFAWTDQRDAISLYEVPGNGFQNYMKRDYTAKCIDTTTGRIVGKILKTEDDEGLMYEAKYIRTSDIPIFDHIGYFINRESAKTAVESKFNPKW